MAFEKSVVLDITELGKTLKISTVPKLDLEVTIVTVTINFLSSKSLDGFMPYDTTSTQIIQRSNQVDKTYFKTEYELKIGKNQVNLQTISDFDIKDFVIELIDKFED